MNLSDRSNTVQGLANVSSVSLLILVLVEVPMSCNLPPNFFDYSWVLDIGNCDLDHIRKVVN